VAIRSFFEEESRRLLSAMQETLDDPDRTAVAELLPAVRELRGTAQIARDDAVLKAARALESALKAIAAGTLAWSEDVQARVAAALTDLAELIERGSDADSALADGAVDRWHEIGLPGKTQETAAAGDPSAAADADRFLAFAAAEVADIASVLETALEALGSNPMDREALKTVLRRQRALLGAARLDELPVIADTLRAVEDISRIIAKMNVAIKDEWLDVFRCARHVLGAAAEPLSQGAALAHSPALSRLRTYREELLERYGAGDEVSAAAPPADGLLQPVPGQDQATVRETGHPRSDPPQDGSAAGPRRSRSESHDETNIQDLIYTGEAALRRALELRARLERAVEDDPDALALVDEVFDLIRLALR
jgi:chemotaxis protein histidine kinase CheA